MNKKELLNKNLNGLRFKENNNVVDIYDYKIDIGCRKCNETGNIDYKLENYLNVDLLTLEIGLEIPNSNNEGDLHKKYKFENIDIKTINLINKIVSDFELNFRQECLICKEVENE